MENEQKGLQFRCEGCGRVSTLRGPGDKLATTLSAAYFCDCGGEFLLAAEKDAKDHEERSG